MPLRFLSQKSSFAFSVNSRPYFGFFQSLSPQSSSWLPSAGSTSDRTTSVVQCSFLPFCFVKLGNRSQILRPKFDLASFALRHAEPENLSTSVLIIFHQSASISINQHQSASISINQHQSTSLKLCL
jgi:hypothetical protein